MTRGNQDTTKTTLARTRGPKAGAFTLVELLVVIGILAVLASLITGVTVYVMDKANREQTLSNQQVIINAIDRFYEIMGEYPPDDNDTENKLDVIENQGGINNKGYLLICFLTTGRLNPDLSASTFSNRLRGRIPKIRKATAAVLLELPVDSLADAGFRDAYGNIMWYEMAGGLGGTPVVISAGPDGKGYWQPGGTPADDEDNIRSDSR